LLNKISPKFSSKKAHKMQRELSKKLLFEDILPETIDYVAGVDVAFLEGTSVGAVAVLDYTTLSLIEFQVAYVKTSFLTFPPSCPSGRSRQLIRQ
jgi:deoxyinosine 3'endonuclease (endonuclease V)